MRKLRRNPCEQTLKLPSAGSGPKQRPREMRGRKRLAY